MPTASSCLLCCSLRTGVFLIGYFQVIISVAGMVVSVLKYFNIHAPESENLYKSCLIVLFCICILILALGFMLLIGNFQQNVNQFKPWMVIQVIAISFLCSMLAFCLALAFFYDHQKSVSEVFSVISLQFLLIGEWFFRDACVYIWKILYLFLFFSFQQLCFIV